MNEYYSNSDVRARMCEFLGGPSVEKATAEYLTAGDHDQNRHREPRPVADLQALWELGLDISRSLWDRDSLIAHLDIEYVNFDSPIEAYVDPNRIFSLQKPVEFAIEAILLDCGIRPLHLLSGRGHHFGWRIRQDSAAFKRLAAVGRVPDSLAKLYAQPHRPMGKAVGPDLSAAYAGLALVMEYLAHRIKEQAARASAIPVEVTAVEVGGNSHGREMVSIDISEYGDPLTVRVIRVPFSAYFKPYQQRFTLGCENVAHLAPLHLIPCDELDFSQRIEVMQDVRLAAGLAGRSSAELPDASGPFERLMDLYEASALRKFHDFYYSQDHEPPERWLATYDQVSLGALPYCARHVLEHPNDLLLKPANMERVVRVFLAIGWHPRHIAGLIRSKFERDFGWGGQWRGYDPAFRADFYTRVFAGLFITGVDDLVAFNCQSAKEEKIYCAGDCPFNLEDYKTSLLNRRKYERLARRPFNRLFLPEEHL